MRMFLAVLLSNLTVVLAKAFCRSLYSLIYLSCFSLSFSSSVAGVATGEKFPFENKYEVLFSKSLFKTTPPYTERVFGFRSS